MAIPNKEANYPYITHPFAALTISFSPERLKQIDPARLACLIHAANVHSEPESNPSIDWLISAEADCIAEPDIHCRKAMVSKAHSVL